MRTLHEMSEARFRDRRDAGQQLVAHLEKYRGQPRTVVLGLPRGGVVPATELAAKLKLPLDVLIARKIRAPENPEYAIGAIAEGGGIYLSEEGLAVTQAPADYLDAEIERQRLEIAQRQKMFRKGKSLSLPERTTVLLVDDGVATGSTVIAAIRALRKHEAVERIVLIVPVAPPETAELLRPMVDELVVLSTPEPFWVVGAFYEEFLPVSDEVVCELLDAAEERAAA